MKVKNELKYIKYLTISAIELTKLINLKIIPKVVYTSTALKFTKAQLESLNVVIRKTVVGKIQNLYFPKIFVI